jgi:hypothetical protein
MFKKRIEIFKKASNSLKISLKCYAFLKKSLALLKKSLLEIATLPIGQPAPEPHPPLPDASNNFIGKISLKHFYFKICMKLDGKKTLI